VDGKLRERGRPSLGCNRLKKRCGCTQSLNAPKESPMFKCVTLKNALARDARYLGSSLIYGRSLNSDKDERNDNEYENYV